MSLHNSKKHWEFTILSKDQRQEMVKKDRYKLMKNQTPKKMLKLLRKLSISIKDLSKGN